MRIQLIRNATLRVTYGSRTFLIDPYLAAKHTLPSYTGASPNPLVDLPFSPEKVVAGSEVVLVSHLHSDHFDAIAQDTLPQDTLIFCQPGDEKTIREKGFARVTAVVDQVVWQGITIQRTPGRHGSSEAVLKMMGKVSGFVMQADKEPTVYWAGDTVWYEAVSEVIDTYQPDIIITHSSGAVWGDGELIVMDGRQTAALCSHSPTSQVIAVHMEALDHGTTTRAALRQIAEETGIDANQLFIPADGETLEFN